jgi:hypothetical protein
MVENSGVPYGIRTRVAAVKEKGTVVIQLNLAAWIAIYRNLRAHGNAHWTLSGLVFLWLVHSHLDELKKT